MLWCWEGAWSQCCYEQVHQHCEHNSSSGNLSLHPQLPPVYEQVIAISHCPSWQEEEQFQAFEQLCTGQAHVKQHSARGKRASCTSARWVPEIRAAAVALYLHVRCSKCPVIAFYLFIYLFLSSLGFVLWESMKHKSHRATPGLQPSGCICLKSRAKFPGSE